LLRSYVDFRQIPKDAEDEERYRAPVLEWYALLTEGFQKGRLAQEKQVQTLQNVKRWVSDTLTPMLAVICATPGGEEWLQHEIVRGICSGGKTDTAICSSNHPLGFTGLPAVTRAAHVRGTGGVARLPRCICIMLTVKELSAWLNIKPSTLYLWVSQNKIPCRRIHGLSGLNLTPSRRG
jgi:hypothetical protein